MGKFPKPLILKCLLAEQNKFRYEVFVSFEYITENKEVIVVPFGFKTDFANEATVVHNYLCYLWKKGKYDRKKADKIILEAMEVLGVSWLKRRTMYAGARAYSIATFKK